MNATKRHRYVAGERVRHTNTKRAGTVLRVVSTYHGTDLEVQPDAPLVEGSYNGPTWWFAFNVEPVHPVAASPLTQKDGEG